MPLETTAVADLFLELELQTERSNLRDARRRAAFRRKCQRRRRWVVWFRVLRRRLAAARGDG